MTNFTVREPDVPAQPVRTEPIDIEVFRWVWVAFIVLATSIPYLWFWYQTPAGHAYTWILPPYPQDSFGYMAWAQQAVHGSILFRLKYTAIPHSGFLLHPLFLLSGWINKLFACPIGIVHWALKALGTTLFFVVFYRYIDWLGLSRFQAVVASVLAGLSPGLGGIFVFFGLVDQSQIVRLVNQGAVVPVDLWMPEVSSFWSFLWNPLFPYSLTLLVLVIYLIDRGTSEARKADVMLAGVAAGLLALVHPYILPMVFAFAVITSLVRRGPAALSLLVRFFLTCCPFVLYVALVTELHPLVSRHSGSGQMRNPSIVDYLLGFGFPLMVMVAGLMVGHTQWVKRHWPLVLWFVLSLGLAVLPWWFQRKLLFGAQIPLSILAAISLDSLVSRVPFLRTRNWALTGAVAVLPLLAATPASQLIGAGRELRRNLNDTYYVSNDILSGFEFLKNRTQTDDVVFASWDTSRMIPAFSGNTVIWGHWAMSVDVEERRLWESRLFGENADWENRQRSVEFWGTGIQYIFADGNLKRSIEQNPEKWRVILSDADKVFSNASVLIYKHGRAT